MSQRLIAPSGADVLCDEEERRLHRLNGVVAVPGVPGVVLAGLGRCAVERDVVADDGRGGLSVEGVGTV